MARSLRENSEVLPSPTHLIDHTYCEPDNISRTITPQYADDISWLVIGSHHLVDHYKTTIPPRLSSRNLHCNTEKTEEHAVSHHGNDNWKRCKYLGSRLGTEEDLIDRKQKANNSMNAWDKIWKNTRIPDGRKLYYFSVFVEPIFLYNAELWAMSANLANKINAFQRRLLRRVINIRYPKRISTLDLQQQLKYTDWSDSIDQRRLRLFGHLMRLPTNTPAKLALEEAERKVPLRVGRPPTTWLSVMKNQLTTLGLKWDDACKTATTDRDSWRELCNRWKPKRERGQDVPGTAAKKQHLID